MNKTTAILLIVSAFPLLGVETDISPTRTATASEVSQLFGLATMQPTQMHIVADIKETGPAWTKEEVSAELRLQNEVMAKTDTHLSGKERLDLQLARSNIIVQCHSGVKIKHLQEWYLGSKYRLDQTDESYVSMDYLKTNRLAYHDTYVNVGDPTFSPYESFSVNHQLRDALLTKDPAKFYARSDLWRILGLEEPLSLPVIIAFVDNRSVVSSRPENGSERDLRLLKTDFQKVEEIREGSNQIWHLEANDELFNGLPVVRLKLTGQLVDMESEDSSFTPIEATYWIAQKSGHSACIQGLLTNLTKRSSFFCSRGKYEMDGNPREWKTSIFNPGLTTKEFVCNVSKIETGATFNAEEVFAPIFPTNYTVSDLTFGTAVVLQRPHPERQVVAVKQASENARFVVFFLLIFISVVPFLGFMLTKNKHSKGSIK